MIAITIIFGALSWSVVLCLGLSHAAQVGNAASAAYQLTASQADRAQGHHMSDKKEGGHSRAAKTITGTVLRVEGDHVFIEGKNGKEMRVHVDKTTQMGNNIERGEPVEAMVNDQHHALSILSGPAVTDRRNDKE